MEIGPGLSAVVREQVEKRAGMPGGDKLYALLYTMPVRVRKTDKGRWEGDGDGKPFDRTTVSRDWHKAALQDADLRDMPLHTLRHTAAAAWLAGGNSLKYVQDQLRHGDIRTTERRRRQAGPHPVDQDRWRGRATALSPRRHRALGQRRKGRMEPRSAPRSRRPPSDQLRERPHRTTKRGHVSCDGGHCGPAPPGRSPPLLPSHPLPSRGAPDARSR